MSAETRKALYYQRKAAGLCTQCGTVSSPGMARCDSCNATQNKLGKIRQDAGLCSKCGRRTPANGTLQCQQCLDSSKRYLRNRTSKRLAQGLCVDCGDPNPITRKCVSCIFKMHARGRFGCNDRWPELRDLYEAQQGLCPYFKIPIAIGVNAELDHIIPRAKGGTDDITNLQWIHCWANRIKADTMPEAFEVELEQVLKLICLQRFYNSRRL